MSEHTQLTKEQSALLQAAIQNKGAVLMASPGSENDVLWGQFCDEGWMEPADAPAEFEFLHCWKLTDEGQQTLDAAIRNAIRKAKP